MNTSRPDNFFRISRAIFSAIVLALAASLAVWGWRQIRAHESTDVADVAWTVGGKTGVCSRDVVDSEEQPVRGMQVALLGGSGYVGGETDAVGHIDVRCPEGEVQAIRVGDVEIMKRPYAAWLGPHVDSGLQVKIILKKREPVGATAPHDGV